MDIVFAIIATMIIPTTIIESIQCHR